MSKEIVSVNPKDFGIEESRAKSIQAAFLPMLDKMVELEAEYNEILTLEISEETCKKAKSLRAKYVKVRTGTAEIHKEQKAFYLSAGRFIDSWKNTQLSASQGIEEKLSAIENYFENIKKEAIRKLQEERSVEYSNYGGEVIPGNLGEMEEEVWKNFLTGTKINYETMKAAEEKALQDKIERERKQELEKVRRFQCSKLISFIPGFEEILFAELSETEYKDLVDEAVTKRSEYEAELKSIREENDRLLKAEQERNQKEFNEKLAKEEEAKKLLMASDNEKLVIVRKELLDHINKIDNVSLEDVHTNDIKVALVASLYDSIERLTDYIESL